MQHDPLGIKERASVLRVSRSGSGARSSDAGSQHVGRFLRAYIDDGTKFELLEEREVELRRLGRAVEACVRSQLRRLSRYQGCMISPSSTRPKFIGGTIFAIVTVYWICLQ